MTLGFPHAQLPDLVKEDRELHEMRKRAEAGLRPVYACVPYDKDRFLVVLQDNEELFYCHQYISTLFGWKLQVDHTEASLMTMFNWLAHNHYVK